MIGLSIRLAACLLHVCSMHVDSVSSMQPTLSDQPHHIFYPGIVVDFNCKVAGPFIQVNDIERTPERGIDGYVADLRALGIEAKGLSPNNSFIPAVCVNGSSQELRRTSKSTAITMACQEIQLDTNFQPIYIIRVSFTLTHMNQLPPPAAVHVNDNMLVWSRPPSVTNSSESSHTYSIEVNHTLEYTYVVRFTNVATRTTSNILLSSDTFHYNLSQAIASDRLEPCVQYNISVCAHNTESGLVGLNSQSISWIQSLNGCMISSTDFETPVATFTTPSSTIDKGQTVVPIGFIAGLVGGIVTVLLIILVVVVIILIFIWIKNRKQNKNAVKKIHVEDFIAKENMYEESKGESDPPSTYKQSSATTNANLYTTVTIQTGPQDKNPSNGQQSSSLIYADLALQTGSTAPLPADAQTYVTVQTKSA